MKSSKSNNKISVATIFSGMQLYHTLLVMVGSNMQRRLGDIIFSFDACALAIGYQQSGDAIRCELKDYQAYNRKNILREDYLKPQLLL